MNAVTKIIWGILQSSFELLLDMAPYLILGFFIAGILNEFVSAEKIAKHLGRSNLGSVVKAAIFGIPLPLCSCGVIPPTVALRKAGASRGSVLSFLIATPTSGVDSIAATYSLLGPFFAVYRVVASFVTAIFSGTAANLLDHSPESVSEDQRSRSLVSSETNLLGRIKHVFYYAFIELISEIGKWLVIGILIGGIITYLLPENFFSETLSPGVLTILLMIVISVPIYVCATGSIPIAAALMIKGLNPGAAFVFLLAGPATNSVTITVISKFLGKKSIFIYLITLIVSSVGLGILLDLIWGRFGLGVHWQHLHEHELLPMWLQISTTVLLLGLLFLPPLVRLLKKIGSKTNQTTIEGEMQTTLKVPNMTCNNCVAHVKKAVGEVDGVEDVDIDLKSKRVNIQHQQPIRFEKIREAIETAGYEVSDIS